MDLTTPARELSDHDLEARYAYLAAQSMADAATTHRPQHHEAAHAASEFCDDDKCQHGEGSGVVLWPMGVVIMLALGSFIAWIAR